MSQGSVRFDWKNCARNGSVAWTRCGDGAGAGRCRGRRRGSCEGAAAARDRSGDQGEGTQARGFTANLEKREETLGLVPAVLQAFGRIDILVNNAATMRRAPASTSGRHVGRHDRGESLECVLPESGGRRALVERGGGGKIVNIASMLSFQGGITVPSYAAAKGGVAQRTKAFANEWAPHRINVNAIAPLYGHGQHQRVASGPRAEPANRRADRGRAVGNTRRPGGAVVFLSSRASDYVNGHVLVLTRMAWTIIVNRSQLESR